jgi:ATP-binding cassette subfamily B (MDR/TAP) protein 1
LILESFYHPSAGMIKIDGIDLRTINLYKLREQMALVEQQPRLFSGTIKDNICYGLNENDIPMERIIEAATISNAHEFITNLPSVCIFMGFYTIDTFILRVTRHWLERKVHN